MCSMDVFNEKIKDKVMENEGKSISLPIAGGEQQVTSSVDVREEDKDVMHEIKAEVERHKLVLYMKGTPEQPMCGFSYRAASVLTSYGVPLHTVNILEDPEKRQALKEYSDWPTFPQVYVGGDLLGGSDLLMQMHESGQLEEILHKAFGV